MPAIRALEGDRFRIFSIASVAATVAFTAVVTDDKGKDHAFGPFTHTPNTDRTSLVESFSYVPAAGYVTGLTITQAGGLERGQVFVRIDLMDRNGLGHGTLAQGYAYEGGSIPLGAYVESGPGGGEGFLSWVSLAADVTPVDVTRVLAAANAIRKIWGFAWYYNASAAAASRTLIVTVREIGLALPTGQAAGATSTIFYQTPTLTLTASEEGAVLAYAGRVMTNDAATISSVNTDTNPSPFPYVVDEDDLANIVFDVGAADVDDRHSIYLLQEEWLRG